MVKVPNFADQLISIVPDAEDLLDFEPQEIGGLILEILHQNAAIKMTPPGSVPVPNRKYFATKAYRKYPNKYHTQIMRLLMEGWGWLEGEGLIAPEPYELQRYRDTELYFITRKGNRFKNHNDFTSYISSRDFPFDRVHPKITDVKHEFSRRDFETAVFKSFKQLEIEIRDACQLDPSYHGLPLIAEAFRKGSGKLIDSNQLPAEQDSLFALFKGAFGSYRNPVSHRNVALSANEAFEMILIASHLLNIVDSRRQLLSPT